MGILTVRAPDSQQAMEEVARRLGPDAYILSTRQRDGMVEIRASRELPPPEPRLRAVPEPHEPRLQAVPEPPEPAPAEAGLRVQTFGELLEARQRERPSLVASRDWVPPALRRAPRGMDALAATLLPDLPAQLPPRLAVIGPPGSGRTLLALRLAALAMEERPGTEPVLIAPRLAIEGPDARLRHWTRLLGLALERPALAEFDPFAWEPDPARPEILDLSSIPEPSAERLEDLMEAGFDLVCALPAGLQPRLAGRLAAATPRGTLLCLTRTDLCTPDLAELRALAGAGRPLAWESGGSGLVDALRRLDRARLDEWAAAAPDAVAEQPEEMRA